MQFPMIRALTRTVPLLLLALVPAFAAQAGDPAAALADVKARYKAALDEYRAKMQAAKPEERSALKAPATDAFVVELAEVARSAQGSETAAEAWMMVVQLVPQAADRSALGDAVERLARDHGESPKAAPLGGMLARQASALGADVAQGHLRKLVELAPKGTLQAGALLGLANALGDDERTTAGSAAEKELEAVVARIRQDYGETLDERERSYASVADGILFARQRLQVGMSAPEIEAADTQGVSFKLSEYRGKVVLLDFWGNW